MEQIIVLGFFIIFLGMISWLFKTLGLILTGILMIVIACLVMYNEDKL
jgi:hypothetical protein